METKKIKAMWKEIDSINKQIRDFRDWNKLSEFSDKKLSEAQSCLRQVRRIL